MKILAKLFEIAKKTQRVGGSRVCAAVTKRGKIISIAVNQYRTHPKQKHACNPERIYLHAEIAAIVQATRQLGDDLSECILWVARAKMSNGAWVMGNSKPCDSCEEEIETARIGKVYFS